MKLPRRTFLHLVTGVAALPAVSCMSWAQAYPTRPVRIIVGFPAGLGPDITARLIAQLLSERFGQSFIVGNLEQYPLSVISGLAERTVVSTRAKVDPRSGPF